MALPRTFTFTGSDGTDLTTYSADFAYVGTGLNAIEIASNAMQGAGFSVENLAVVDSETFNSDQSVEGRIAVAVNARKKGVCARMDGSGNGYAWYGNGPSSYGNMYLILETLRVPTQLGTVAQPFAPNKYARLECTGTTIEGFFDGVSKVSVTDATWSSGKAGLAFVSAGGAASVDDLTVDNIGGGGGGPTIPNNRRSLLGVGI